MSEQIFISYRREGGDVTAKLICEALKNRGYTVFYDFDSLQGGFFDERIYNAIEECDDFILVLPPNSLDRCKNDTDWVRLEIRHAINCGKNVIPVLLPGFSFPHDLPEDISNVSRYNGIPFVMAFFDRAVIPEIVDRLSHKRVTPQFNPSTTTYQPQKPSSSENLEFSENGEGYSVSCGGCTDTDIIIPEFHNGKPVTTIATKAFEDCAFIKSVTIPNSVTCIGEEAFNNCFALTSVNIPSGVRSIGEEAFAGCSSLPSITIPDGVTIIEEWAFYDCSSLTSVNIPDSVTYIGGRAFYGCSSLTALTIPESVETIGIEAFAECSSLVSINIPSNVTVIEDWAFSGCESLASITIPNSVTSIGGAAFSGCASLFSITIPESVINIDMQAFSQCSSLNSIIILNGLERIGEKAFYDCSALTSVVIPSSVTSIQNEAFGDCPKLDFVVFKGARNQWRNLCSDDVFGASHNISIACFDGNIYI